MKAYTLLYSIAASLCVVETSSAETIRPLRGAELSVITTAPVKNLTAPQGIRFCGISISGQFLSKETDPIFSTFDLVVITTPDFPNGVGLVRAKFSSNADLTEARPVAEIAMRAAGETIIPLSSQNNNARELELGRHDEMVTFVKVSQILHSFGSVFFAPRAVVLVKTETDSESRSFLGRINFMGYTKEAKSLTECVSEMFRDFD